MRRPGHTSPYPQVRRSPRPANQLWDIIDFTAHATQSPRDRIFELQSTVNQTDPVLMLKNMLIAEEQDWLAEFFEGGSSTVRGGG